MGKNCILKEINKKKIINLKKESLIKLISLYEFVKKKSIIDEIIEGKEYINESTEKTILNIRLMSLENSLKESYFKKNEKENFVIYYYKNEIVIYFKKETNKEELKNIIEENNIKKNDKLVIIRKGENKKIKMKSDKLEENIVNNIEKIIIKIKPTL